MNSVEQETHILGHVQMYIFDSTVCIQQKYIVDLYTDTQRQEHSKSRKTKLVLPNAAVLEILHFIFNSYF